MSKKTNDSLSSQDVVLVIFILIFAALFSFVLFHPIFDEFFLPRIFKEESGIQPILQISVYKAPDTESTYKVSTNCGDIVNEALQSSVDHPSEDIPVILDFGDGRKFIGTFIYLPDENVIKVSGQETLYSGVSLDRCFEYSIEP